MLQNINVKKLHPHPDNPRKDLGDLSELAESIKVRGVLQNLTVVPWFSAITRVGCDDPKAQEEMGYTVVIGHRRLAAAKLAGLTELPCIITDMDQRTQVATMLLENIQRSDLTIYEQAQGFQMMLDLGESINSISDATGFSETTVRRRIKLNELDQNKFKESMGRGATLMDYAELEKIEDLELRNRVLDTIGTSNFKWELKNAIDKEKNAKDVVVLVEKIKAFAEEIETMDYSKMLTLKTYYTRDVANFEPPEDSGEIKYYFVQKPEYGYVTVCYERTFDPKVEDPELAKRLEERERKRAGLAEATKRAHELRTDFAMNLSNATAKKNLDVIAECSVRCVLDRYDSRQFEIIEKAFDIKQNDDDEWDFNYIRERVFKQPERALFLTTYCRLDSKHETYLNWDGISHKTNSELDIAYDFLCDLGYQMSDDEKQLQDGSHELFAWEA